MAFYQDCAKLPQSFQQSFPLKVLCRAMLPSLLLLKREVRISDCFTSCYTKPEHKLPVVLPVTTESSFHDCTMHRKKPLPECLDIPQEEIKQNMNTKIVIQYLYIVGCVSFQCGRFCHPHTLNSIILRSVTDFNLLECKSRVYSHFYTTMITVI